MKAKVTLVLVVCLLSGCARFGSELSMREASTPGPRAADILFFADRLAAASPEELAAMPEREPPTGEQPGAALRHALWLATSGHDGHDPAAARDTLERLVTRAEGLEASVRSLVRLQLRHLRERLELARENGGLAAKNARLREQIQALTALERQMGNGGSGGTNGDAGDPGGDGAVE